MFPVEMQDSDQSRDAVSSPVPTIGASIVSSPNSTITISEGSSQVSTTSQPPSPTIHRSMIRAPPTRRGDYRPARPLRPPHAPFFMPSPFMPPVGGFVPPPVAPPPYHYYPPIYLPPPTYPPPQYFTFVSEQIVRQIDFYFSDDNLARDFYLRSNMDNNGWVSIRLIANFPMVRKITWDIALILEALRYSRNVTVQGEKVRKQKDWQKWIPKLP